MSQRPPFLRRKFLINNRFQLELIFYFLAFYTVTLVAIYLLMWKTLGAVVDEAARVMPHSREALLLLQTNYGPALSRVYLMFGITGAAFTFMGGVMISHRAVGPLFRLRRILAQAAQGDVTEKIECRKDDYFQDLFVELSKLLSAVGKTKPDR